MAKAEEKQKLLSLRSFREYGEALFSLRLALSSTVLTGNKIVILIIAEIRLQQ
jgi:hypothetical protein